MSCENGFLRAAASQRPNQKLLKNQTLTSRVERALAHLLMREIKIHAKLENFKRALEQMYDFSPAAAFATIDDVGLGYLDEKNLKRFFRNMGHVASRQEIVSLIRRFDIDGDCKLSREELIDGLTSYERKTVKKAIKSSGSKRNLSAEKNKIYLSAEKRKRPQSSAVTPKRLSSAKASVNHSMTKSR